MNFWDQYNVCVIKRSKCTSIIQDIEASRADTNPYWVLMFFSKKMLLAIHLVQGLWLGTFKKGMSIILLLWKADPISHSYLNSSLVPTYMFYLNLHIYVARCSKNIYKTLTKHSISLLSIFSSTSYWFMTP